GRSRVVPYLLAQIAGALLASLKLRVMVPAHPTLGATLPAGTDLQSWAMEVVLTLMLMVVILSVSAGAKEKG
ncbi:aquaporin, partial [Clostridium butyricum]|nr:aquaporin [Clostridium butyricum]